jgi:class 3 adenylate cyclase
VDVVGSTALGESTDPEAVRPLLARYFQRMKEIVDHHGGTIEKFIGDAVMAVFGIPIAHEDDQPLGESAGVQAAPAGFLPSARVPRARRRWSPFRSPRSERCFHSAAIEATRPA